MNNRSRRSRRAVAALALTAWVNACMSYVPASAETHLPLQYRVRVHSAAPFALTAPAGSLTALPVCRVTGLEARLTRSAGDTLVLSRVNHIAAAADSAGRVQCPSIGGPVTLIRAPEMDITYQRVNKGRTTALVVGLLAALVAFAAYGASQIQTGFPSSGGY